tara:strand:- start:1174 stop:1458 length:285 start_codon:yes stop_codon:yes gene_type:complete
MNIQKIAKSVDNTDRELIIKAVAENISYNANFSRHKSEPINLMYNLWDKYFPTQKQDINCSSCRNAVVKFWNTMCDEWSNEIVKPKKKNVKKTK